MSIQRYLNKKMQSKYLRIIIFTILIVLWIPVCFIWSLWDGGLKEFINDVIIDKDCNFIGVIKEYWKSMEGNNEKAD